jgi:uncharacterized protein (TIGR00255 family)
MIRSMTGYGRFQQIIDGYNILVEIKSVNHRFYEFSARVPRIYGYIEEKLKVYIQSFISRGKVDVFVTIDNIEGSDTEIRLNDHVAKSYIGALQQLQDQYNLRNDISVSTVSRYTDIFTVLKSPENEEKVWNAVKAVADKCINEFVEMRIAEGERLKRDIVSRVNYIAEVVTIIEQRSPKTVEEYREKLLLKMKEVLNDSKYDESRIIMEAAIYADKVSVNEETVRLKSHLTQFEFMLKSDEPIGRKLDFLMQEINREANTIGSKGNDVEIARNVVDVKAELEKIREQIQNIE